MVKTAEFLRRELVTYGESIRSPLEEYRRLRIEVYSIARAIILIINQEVKQPQLTEGKQPGEPTEVIQPTEGKQLGEPTEVKPLTNDQPKPKLPTLFLRRSTDSYACLYAKCDPNYLEVLEHEARQKVEEIKQEKAKMAEELKEEKNKILATITKDWEKGREKVIEDQVRKDIIKKLRG